MRKRRARRELSQNKSSSHTVFQASAVSTTAPHTARVAMRTTRQRGHSFYEDDEVVEDGKKSAGSSPGRGSVGSGSGVGGDDGAGLNTSRDSTESSTSGSSASLSSGDGDQEAEELNFPRGRARSRSILGPPDLSGSGGEGSGIVKYDPANPPASTGSKENKEVPQVPKSGPLAQHEIQVLKKVRDAMRREIATAVFTSHLDCFLNLTTTNTHTHRALRMRH